MHGLFSISSNDKAYKYEINILTLFKLKVFITFRIYFEKENLGNVSQR